MPLVPFGVTRLGYITPLMITSSHSLMDDNGYKVYNAICNGLMRRFATSNGPLSGCQVDIPADKFTERRILELLDIGPFHVSKVPVPKVSVAVM